MVEWRKSDSSHALSVEAHCDNAVSFRRVTRSSKPVLNYVSKSGAVLIGNTALLTEMLS